MIAYVTMLAAAAMLGVALPAGAAELAGSEWRPIRIGAASWAEDAGVFVRFEGDGRLAGHAGGNRFLGRYAVAGDRIEIAPVAAIRMACPEPAVACERLFLAVLEGARRFARNGTELTLADGEGTSASFVQTDWD